MYRRAMLRLLTGGLCLAMATPLLAQKRISPNAVPAGNWSLIWRIQASHDHGTIIVQGPYDNFPQDQVVFAVEACD